MTVGVHPAWRTSNYIANPSWGLCGAEPDGNTISPKYQNDNSYIIYLMTMYLYTMIMQGQTMLKVHIIKAAWPVLDQLPYQQVKINYAQIVTDTLG